MPTRTPHVTIPPRGSVPAPRAPHFGATRLVYADWVLGAPRSVNHIYGRRRDGTSYLTAEAAEWRVRVAEEVMLQRQNLSRRDRDRIRAGEAALTLAASVTGAAGARADVDNLLKLVLDGVKLGLQVDDRYIISASVLRLSPPEAGGPLDGLDGVFLQIGLVDLLPGEGQTLATMADERTTAALTPYDDSDAVDARSFRTRLRETRSAVGAVGGKQSGQTRRSRARTTTTTTTTTKG